MKPIRFVMFCLIGATLGAAECTPLNWQFWVVMSLAAGIAYVSEWRVET